VPVGMRLLLGGFPGMTGNLLWVRWCGESRDAEPCGQCGRLVAFELDDADAGDVADVGRAGLMVEEVDPSHRDSSSWSPHDYHFDQSQARWSRAPTAVSGYV